MAYKVIILYQLYMPSYFLGTFTEYPYVKKVHIPADTRSAFPVISVQSPVSIQCCWQS